MAKSLDYRAFGQRGLVIPTPLYVDDTLLADIVLGDKAQHWSEVKRGFERQGFPAARASVRHLYYVPAVIKFLDRREGIEQMAVDFPDDGPDSFYP